MAPVASMFCIARIPEQACPVIQPRDKQSKQSAFEMNLKKALSRQPKVVTLDGDILWTAHRQGLGARLIEKADDYCRYHSIRNLDNIPDYIPGDWHVRKST